MFVEVVFVVFVDELILEGVYEGIFLGYLMFFIGIILNLVFL